jgi:hypothetical protein
MSRTAQLTNRTCRPPQLRSRASLPDGPRPPARRASNSRPIGSQRIGSQRIGSRRIGSRRIGSRRIGSRRVERTRVVPHPRMPSILGAMKADSPPRGSRHRPWTARPRRVRSPMTHQLRRQLVRTTDDRLGPTTRRTHPHARPTLSRRLLRSPATSLPLPRPSTRGPTNHPPPQTTYTHLAPRSPPSRPPRQSLSRPPSCRPSRPPGQAVRYPVRRPVCPQPRRLSQSPKATTCGRANSTGPMTRCARIKAPGRVAGDSVAGDSVVGGGGWGGVRLVGGLGRGASGGLGMRLVGWGMRGWMGRIPLRWLGRFCWTS